MLDSAPASKSCNLSSVQLCRQSSPLTFFFIPACHPLPPLPHDNLCASPQSSHLLGEERVGVDIPSLQLSLLPASSHRPPSSTGVSERVCDNSPSRQPSRLLASPPQRPPPIHLSMPLHKTLDMVGNVEASLTYKSSGKKMLPFLRLLASRS